MKRYEQVPHTADLAAKIYGKDLPGLFENAAYAMFDLIGDLRALATDETAKVEVEAEDTESLLISWLNELLYVSYARRALFSGFNILSLEEKKPAAEIKGQKLEGCTKRLRAEIKAATYHDLEIQRTDEGYVVTVVFDV